MKLLSFFHYLLLSLFTDEIDFGANMGMAAASGVVFGTAMAGGSAAGGMYMYGSDQVSQQVVANAGNHPSFPLAQVFSYRCYTVCRTVWSGGNRRSTCR